MQVEATIVGHEAAQRLARALLDAHLVASAHVHGPVEAHLRVHGVSCRLPHWRLTAITLAHHVEATEELLHREHERGVPFTHALPLVVSDHYRDWVTQSTHQSVKHGNPPALPT